MKKIILSLMLIIACKSAPQYTVGRIEELQVYNICYRIFNDDKPEMTCACINANRGVPFVVELTCQYPIRLGIPMVEIHVKNKEEQK